MERNWICRLGMVSRTSLQLAVLDHRKHTAIFFALLLILIYETFLYGYFKVWFPFVAMVLDVIGREN